MKKYSNDLINFVNEIDNFKCLAVIKNKKTKYYEKYLLLCNETSFLNDNVSVRDRIYYVINDLYDTVKCPHCNKPTKLTKKQKIGFCDVSCSKKYIDPTSGVPIGVVASFKGANTKKSKIDENGISQRTKINTKISKSFTKSKKEKLSKKISKTKNIVNPETGLTNAQESGKKGSKTKNIVNPETGLTNAQESGKKTKISLKQKGFNTMKKNPDLNDKILISTFDDWLNSTFIKYQCKKCGSIRESYYKYVRCTTCFPYNKSIAEHEVLEYCQSLTNNIESNSRRIIKPLELDIYLLNYNLAIEYNGLYYHSSYSIESEDKTYHLNKTQLCREQGIQLFHIFENEWLDPIKQTIWKSIIRNKLGQSTRLYARKTEIRKVDSKTKSEFLDNNHLQGNCQSSVNIGLYLDNELISLMTFGKSRFSKKYDWELLRFCNKIGYSVVGGASKLLSSFKKENNGSIVSYADMRRSNGNLYKQLGFEFSHESPPNYWYFKNSDKSKIFHRILYQKHKLKDKLNTFDPSLTESDNMYNNGYNKIYDCGNQVWVFK